MEFIRLRFRSLHHLFLVVARRRDDDRARRLWRGARLCAGVGDRFGAVAVRGARAGAGGCVSADEVRQFRVSAYDDGIRLDRWFKRHMAEATYTVVAKWARTGQLRVDGNRATRSEEHTSELQSLMRISYAVFCLKKKTKTVK